MKVTKDRVYNIDGTLVHEDVYRVAREIELRYNGQVKVQYLNPDALIELGDYPYRIVEKMPDGGYKLIFGVWQLDNTVLDRLEMLDNWRGGKFLDELVAKEEKDKKHRRGAYQDWSQNQAQPLVASILGSRKSTYKWKTEEGKWVKVYKDGRPPA